MSEVPSPLPAATMRPTMLRPPAPTPPWQVTVGLLLTLPALALLVISYVVPAAWTVRASFQRVNLFGDDAVGVGRRNYAKVFDDGLAGAFGFALSLAAGPLLVVVLVAPLLAWAAHRGGTGSRWVVRGLVALPLAACAPVAIAAGQLVVVGEEIAANPVGVVRGLSWWGTVGLATALGVTLYLAALRRRDPERSPWPAFVTAAVVAAAAAVAVALQAFTLPYLVRSATTTTPAAAVFQSAFVRGDIGAGAAVSTVLLAVLAALGIAVTALVIRSGLRLEFDDRYRSADGAARGRAVGAVTAVVVVLAVLGASWYGLSPWLGDLGAAESGSGEVAVNTWVPSLLYSLGAVTVAALAAFGIGALRPLGRHSEWLLLPFGVFLFVGTAPLSVYGYRAAADLGLVDTLVGLVPPGWVAIPVLFVLTLVFRGQAERRAVLLQLGRPASFARVVLPALPMLAIGYLVTWVVQAQDLLWPLLVGQRERRTGPVELVRTLLQNDLDRLPYGAVMPVVVLVVLVLLALAAQLLYLDRVALRVGLPERDHPPRT